MMPSLDAEWVGAELTRRFGMPLWSLSLTATDANRWALRLGRMVTGRPIIAAFSYCYHGSVDETFVQMGADGVFIGSGIFKSGNPAHRAAACVKATTFYNDAKVLADVSRGLGDAMVGINVADIPVPHRLAERGW